MHFHENDCNLTLALNNRSSDRASVAPLEGMHSRVGSPTVECRGNNMSALLMLFADGQISDTQLAQLQAHTDQCPQCLEDFELYKALATSLCDNLPEHIAPEGFTEAVMARIEALPQEKPKVSPQDMAFRVLGLTGALATGAAITVLPDYAYEIERFFQPLREVLQSISNVANAVALDALELAASVQVALLAIFMGLLALQLVIYKRSPVS